MIRKSSVIRTWINLDPVAAWLTDKKIIPVCYGNLLKGALPHPLSAFNALQLPADTYYLLESVTTQLRLPPISPAAVYRGKMFKGLQDGAFESYDRLAKALQQFKDD